MSIFSKRNVFLRFKTTTFFLISFCSFEGAQQERNSSNPVSCIPSCSLQLTSSCFAPVKAISDKDLEPYFTPIWTIGFSTVTYIKLWSSVKDLQINTLKFRDTFHCRHTYIRYLQIVYFFKNKNIFPVLIDNSNNFEINKLINLVENGMFHFP